MNKIKYIWLLVCMVLVMGCQTEESQHVSTSTPSFDFLQRLTLEELDHRISKKEPLFVYFGWTTRANECIKVQENYLEQNIEYYRWNGLLSVVDLDVELPDALNDKGLRSLLASYEIKYAPAFVFFYEGKVKSYIEWSPESNDVTTGIPVDRMNEWMRSVNLIQ